MADAVKLTDAYDSAGRRITAVDELISETIKGNVKISALTRDADAASRAAWEAVARDLARQVINCETEIAELDEAAEAAIEAEDGDEFGIAATAKLRGQLRDAEQAHCDTYVEAVRLSAELAGWQDSDATQYRKATAAKRLESYQTST